ncbi:hypothetical protein CPB83DRAFT_862810 [Crepidotus variabilis]|uniref:Lysine-specific metallo-endopeptidase domain-containing protein n=1 Tax=Crepidotus variabilis TaxID=179855 RepID=A0A9P6E6M0_9AGAR|nr:hypothetical protein CPB83DRAFT_862810 [Crepidotus variabilis]
MKFVVAISICFLTILGTTASPIPVNVDIKNEQAHVNTPLGQFHVNNIKQAAVTAQSGMHESARVAHFPENPENHAILVEVFKKDFMIFIDTIRKNVETIRDGKLVIADINSAKTDLAATSPKTNEVHIGPKFHSLGRTDDQRARTLIHEASHALAGTKDYFAKSDGKPISKKEAKRVPHICGYLANDFDKLESCQSVWNADSYTKLASLAVEQYKKHGGKPPTK